MKYMGVVTDYEWVNALFQMPQLRRDKILKEQETSYKEYAFFLNYKFNINYEGELEKFHYFDNNKKVFLDEINMYRR